jgi:uncharacterized membrane protein
LLVDIGIFFNISNIISIITRTIDFIAVLIIGVSAIQTSAPIVISLINLNKKNKSDYVFLKSFINSLLLALELESANAILKMAVFVSNATDTIQGNLPTSSTNINNFIFFVALLTVRIAINQTLRKYNIDKSQI